MDLASENRERIVMQLFKGLKNKSEIEDGGILNNKKIEVGIGKSRNSAVLKYWM